MNTPHTMDDLVAHLNANTAPTWRPWQWEHTGGGCFAIVAELFTEGCRVMVTAAEGPLASSDTVESVQTPEGGNGWMIGYYAFSDDEGETVCVSTLAELTAVCAQLVNDRTPLADQD